MILGLVTSALQPIVFSGQQFASFLNAQMAGKRIVVVMANQLCLNDFGYK